MTTPTKFEQTHISMVLDRSGSMASCAIETISAVNTYLADARNDANMKEADFDLTIFDNQSIDTVRAGAPINVADITGVDFVPRGYTPLYDAIGRGIDSLDGRTKASGSGKAILVIVTDGMENASKKYTHGRIQELITARQAAGWLVVFLGAGLDAAIQGAALGVTAGTMASFATDAASMKSMSSSVYGMSSGYAKQANTESARRHVLSGAANLSAGARASMGDQTGSRLGKAPRTTITPRRPAAPAASLQVSDTWDGKATSTADDAWGA